MGNLGISIVDDETSYDGEVTGGSPTVIKVVGCGGGGSNAVNRMIFRNLSNVDFIVLNTDKQALNRSRADTKLAIGQKVTKGLGAGGKPEIGEQAAEDAKLDIDHVLANFSPCMGAVLSRTTTPTIAHMLAGLVNLEATTTAKDYYMRVRPFVLFNEPSLTPEDEPYLRGNGSYPSGHACFGWAVALILAEINPDRQNEIFKYGYEFGQSRVICGVHFQSDVDAGRLMGAATVARLHADKEFMKTLEKAKKEFSKVARKSK